MTKDTPIYVRMTREEKTQLKQLVEATKRSQSDMIRFLVSQEWQREFGGQQIAISIPSTAQ